MDRKIYVIVMAAGSGTRMGSMLPKQFLDLGGKPIIQRTIEKFIYAFPEVHIVTVLPKDHIEYWKKCCIENDFHCPQMIVEGGITRFHSVKNALSKVPEGAIVAIHDGVRPLISVDKIKELFALMETERAVIPVMPMTDSLKVLKKVDGRLIPVEGASVDRSMIYGAQTPQIFLSEDLKQAYEQPYDTLFTDDASVAHRFGIVPAYAEGERQNIKITTPQDMDLARGVLDAER